MFLRVKQAGLTYDIPGKTMELGQPVCVSAGVAFTRGCCSTALEPFEGHTWTLRLKRFVLVWFGLFQPRSRQLLLSYANPKAQQRVVKRGGAGGGCGAHLTNTIFEIERQTFEQSTSAAAAAVLVFLVLLKMEMRHNVHQQQWRTASASASC